MSILGIGVDIVEISRIEMSIKKNPNSFLKHIATEEELQWTMDSVFEATEKKPLNLKRYAEFWAGRFAAKEALSKALGVGIGREFSFLDCSIFYDKQGKPYFEIKKQRKNQSSIFKKKRVKKIHLSISHSRTHAIAYVLIEGA